VGFGTLLERTWTGVTQLVRPQTAAVLFQQAEQYRLEARYDEASELIALGLTEVPDSRLGHLLKAYCHAAQRQLEPARAAFSQVLTYDPYHPRALLGLARLSIEEGDLEGSKIFLDRALSFYADFPEALALRDLLETWPIGATVDPSVVSLDDLDAEHAVDDVLVNRADGTVLAGAGDEERAALIARHVSRVTRMATAALGRAGLGTLRGAVIRADADTVVVATETGLVLSATRPSHADSAAALVELERLADRFTGQAGRP